MRDLARAAPAPLVLALLLAGCDGARSVPAETALQHDRCDGLQAGLTRVDYAELARIRGSRLLDAASSTDAPRADSNDLLLVAVSRGKQPSAGYSIGLREVVRRGRTALIEVEWQAPEPGTMQAQVVTHPCLVVGLAADRLEVVQARDQTGAEIGYLSLGPRGS